MGHSYSGTPRPYQKVESNSIVYRVKGSTASNRLCLCGYFAYCKIWRRRRDSNPRDPFESNGFQDRRFQPLTHSSVSKYNLQQHLVGRLVTLLTSIAAFWCKVSLDCHQKLSSFDTACRFASRLVCVWRIVVTIEECPSSSLTATTSIPEAIKREANVCRNLCHVTPSMPDLRHARAVLL